MNQLGLLTTVSVVVVGLLTFCGFLFLVDTNPLQKSSKCFNAVIDLGANDGGMIREFISPDEQTKMGKFFIEKNWNAKNFCIFAFEGNPFFTARLLEQQKQWREQGYDVRVFPETALSHKEKSVRLYLDPDAKNNYRRSTVVDTEYTRIKGKEWKSVKVKSVMLSKFVEDNVDPAGMLFVNMDIEGAEYRVLYDLVASGLLCSKCPRTDRLLFDYMNIEPHCQSQGETKELLSLPVSPLDQCAGFKVFVYYIKACGISYSSITG